MPLVRRMQLHLTGLLQAALRCQQLCNVLQNYKIIKGQQDFRAAQYYCLRNIHMQIGDE